MIDLSTFKSLQLLINSYHRRGGSVSSDDHSLTISWNSDFVGAGYVEEKVPQLIEDLKKHNIDARFDKAAKKLTIYTEDPELIDEIKELLLISPPTVDVDSNVPYRKVAEAKIPHGRILFRGDARNPNDVFTNGIKPNQVPSDIVNDDDTVVTKAYVSKVGSILALTPYLNTAAIFPINDNARTSSTWVYMTKLDQGLPIAHHSLLLKEEGKHGSASYPAEVITHTIPSESVICAVRVKRNWEMGSYPAMGQPPGNFIIEEILMNPHCTVALDEVSLKEYLEYLDAVKTTQTPLRFSLSEVSGQQKTSFEESQGIMQLAPDLIAQNSAEYPAEAIKKWQALFTNTKVTIPKETIEKTIQEYPQVLSIINPQELSYLLKSYPTIDNSLIFSTLKKMNSDGVSALSTILKNKPEEYFDRDALRDALIYFVKNDTNNQFIDSIVAASSNIQTLNPDEILTAMGHKNPHYKQILQNILESKMGAEDFTLSDFFAERALNVIVQHIEEDPSSASSYAKIINQIVETQINITTMYDFGLFICEMALLHSNKECTGFFNLIIEAAKNQNKAALTILSNPQKNIDSRGRRIISPIISAVKAGNIELVKSWIEAGTSLRNEVSRTHHNTALMTAIQQNQPTIALLILSQGGYAAGLDLKNDDGKSVTDLFTEEHNTSDWDMVRQKISSIVEEKLGVKQTVHFDSHSPASKRSEKPAIAQEHEPVQDQTKKNNSNPWES